MSQAPVYYHIWLRKAQANARAFRAIMKRWFTGQANKKTLQLLGIPQSQERNLYITGRRLRKEHLLAIAETEALRKREIDRAAERILARTKRKIEYWRQRRHQDITKLAFDLRSLAERIEHQTHSDEDFLLVEGRRKRIRAKREKAIATKLGLREKSPPPPRETLWQGPTPDVASEMLEAFPLYDRRTK